MRRFYFKRTKYADFVAHHLDNDKTFGCTIQALVVCKCTYCIYKPADIKEKRICQ
jgi:uncharacterized membrane protein YoaT (DUF817 family)